ncbi:MAG: ABC transporter permease [Acidimicrobiales bacterium]
MSGAGAVWLVAVRELRERSRSRAFRASLVVMALVVAAVVALPSLLSGGGGRADVGLVGATPDGLGEAIQTQGEALGLVVRIERLDSTAAGEEAVRAGRLDVLVVDAGLLEWRRQPDEQLRAVVVGAIQLTATLERAAAAGIGAATLAELVAPVPVENVQLGGVAGRSADDETAALFMNVVLLMVIATFGNLVLIGVVEEKASRVVEVLLARIRPRTLLAGKVLGIGLLGLGQVAITALAALVATSTVDDLDLPAARGAVLAWAVVWFVLGYALFAMVYGALGSLASRSEDAQSAAGPVTVVLIAGYWASFLAVGRPDSVWAVAASFVPPTAPFAMPSRVAMGAVAWWEPVAAAGLTLAAIAALVGIGGRVYANAILHTGPALKLRQVWRRPPVGSADPVI